MVADSYMLGWRASRLVFVVIPMSACARMVVRWDSVKAGWLLGGNSWFTNSICGTAPASGLYANGSSWLCVPA